MIDLHLHSRYSDGEHSPGELVSMARIRGMRLIALTDHDTLTGLREAKSAADDAGIKFIPGIELSARENGIDCHILGYGIDPDDCELIRVCDELAKQRGLREARIFAYLQNSGAFLDSDKVYCHAPRGRAGRAHFALALVDAGYTRSISEAFDKYLSTPKFFKIDRPKPSAGDCIALIQSAGGFASLAHPELLKIDTPAFEALLAKLKGYGLEGLECYHSAHTPKQAEYYLAMAKKHRLIVTEGSDFHGEKLKPGVQIGDCTSIATK